MSTNYDNASPIIHTVGWLVGVNGFFGTNVLYHAQEN